MDIVEDIQLIKKVKISNLKLHHKNIEIYGNESVDDLVENIKKYGLACPLIITDKNVIISGNRRFKACCYLDIKEVDVIIKHYDNEEQELEDLVNMNLTRDRTTEQKAREAMILMEVEKIKAKQRQLKGLNKDTVVAVLPQPENVGKTRDIIAEKVGFRSGREVARAINTIEKIDKLNTEGNKEQADILKGVLNNRNPAAAEKLAKNIDKIEIPNDKKEALKIGKISPNVVINKNEKLETKNCDMCKKEIGIAEFNKDKSICNECLKITNGTIEHIDDDNDNHTSSKYSWVDINKIENDFKYNPPKGYVVKPEAEFLEYEANTNSYINFNQKFIDNIEIFGKTPQDIKEKFLNRIEALEGFLIQLKNLIKGGENNDDNNN